METKYYTPTIEEFHIGFEFESNYLKRENEWAKSILSIDNMVDFLEMYIYDATPLEFRVKLLDFEDIENLGWIQRDYDTFDFGNNMAFEFIPEDVSSIYTYGGGKNSDTIFRGKIKNKSELKKLMQQLNIE